MRAAGVPASVMPALMAAGKTATATAIVHGAPPTLRAGKISLHVNP
jgi:hypothetical protein